jgi:alcohol dehydrogenase
VVLFLNVTPNPRLSEVQDGARLYQEENCDVIVAVGGGSPIDCAKGIGVLTANRRPLRDFVGVDRIELPSPPLLCIPTTAGSGAEVSQFAILTELEERQKLAIVSKAVVPDAALVDPEPLVTQSPYLTACAGLDALAHAFEAYLSNAASYITDLHAREAVRQLWPNLLPSMHAPQDLELRRRLMRGSLSAGLAFSNASLGAVHAMAHPLGGLTDETHGQCTANLLPHVIRYNYVPGSESAARYDQLAQEMGLPVSEAPPSRRVHILCNAIFEMLEKTCLLQPLAAQGLSSSDIPAIAAQAMRDPCMVTNPRRPNQEEIEELYANAL